MSNIRFRLYLKTAVSLIVQIWVHLKTRIFEQSNSSTFKKTRFFENSNTRILVRVKFIRTPIPVRHLSTTTCSLTPFYCLLPTETNNMWMNFQSRSKLLISATWILGWWTYISILYHKWGTSICLTVYIVEREKWEEGVITIEGSTCLWRHSDRIYGKSKVSTDRTALIVF